MQHPMTGKLRELRGKHTQQEIADAVGLKRASYTMIETGARRPSPKVAMRLGKVLGFDWTRFFDDSEDEREERVG